MERRKINFYILVLLFINVLSTYGLFYESEDCRKINNFFIDYPKIYLPECCSDQNLICDDNGNLTKMCVPM